MRFKPMGKKERDVLREIFKAGWYSPEWTPATNRKLEKRGFVEIYENGELTDRVVLTELGRTVAASIDRG